MQPRPRFAGTHRVSIQVVGACGPPRSGEAAPLRAFAPSQIRWVLAGEGHRRHPVRLRPDLRAVRPGPGGERLQVLIFAEFAEGEAPIVPDRAGRGTDIVG